MQPSTTVEIRNSGLLTLFGETYLTRQYFGNPNNGLLSKLAQKKSATLYFNCQRSLFGPSFVAFSKNLQIEVLKASKYGSN